MAGIVHTEGLTKHYGRVVGVADLWLDVEPGEVMGFLGPNGAGKTTTIRLLLDLIHPTAGRAAICGFDCRREGLKARAHVGYLPGELPIYPELSGAQYLEYLARLRRQPVDGARFDRLCARFGVGHADLGRPLRALSHGTRRKLGILQALAAAPAVLILDEPTSGLDPLMIEAFAETIAEIRREGRSTVFLSSHVLSEIERTCDRIALIRRGRLAAVTTLAEIQRTSPRRVSVRFATPVSDAPGDLPGASAIATERLRWSFDVVGPLGPLLARIAGLPVTDLEVEPFSLEDYVLRLYRDE